MSLSYYLPRKRFFLLYNIGIVLIISILNSSLVNAKSCEKWQSIRTPHYDILFLSNIGREAQRMANTLEALYLPISKSLRVSPKRIPIVLKSQIAISNGFSAIGPPRRVDFFTFPSQDYNFVHNSDWLNLLAIHELRHVAQFKSIIENYSYATPAWLMEGDAVGIETALSKGGRGRIPYFGLLYKVNLLERGESSYYKQMLGSFKHQIPDHYRLGYFMTTHLRRKYGSDIIGKLLQRDGFLESINPGALYNRCKKLTGKTLLEIYQDTNVELKTLWTNQLKGLNITPCQSIHIRDSEEYIDYSYPQPTNKGIVVLKSGIGTITHFVCIDEQGQENKIFTPGAINSDIRFSAAKDKIVWIENMVPLRWEHKRYTAIQSYNLSTRKFKTLAYPSRYSSVSLSPDVTKLVACETDEAYNHWLVILDIEKGTILHTFPNPDNYYYLTPTWSPDGRYIIAVKHAHNKSTITVIDIQTGASQDILPYTEELIGCPILQDSYVYYNSAYSGIDNIYAIHLKTKQRFQVTSSKYGAYNPTISADGKWLLYNDFGRNGMNAVKMPLKSQEWTPIEKIETRSICYYESLIVQENNSNILAHISDSTYQIEEYTPWKNFNNIKPQLTILPGYYPSMLIGGFVFRDLLEKIEWVLPGVGYEFHSFKIHTGRFFSRFIYKGWYPLIMLDANISPTLIIHEHAATILVDREFSLRIEIPFAWNVGQYTHRLSLSSTAMVKTSALINSFFRTQNYMAHFSRKSARSSRDLCSPWGQELLISYTHAPYGGSPVKIWGTKLDLYFPGLYKHHSISLKMMHEYNLKIPGFLFASGVKLRNHEDRHIKRPISTSINYAFPIAYPDFKQLPFTVLQRLKANLFYDWVYDLDFKIPLHIIGADLILDMPWFHIGIRCMYKITGNKIDSALLFGN